MSSELDKLKDKARLIGLDVDILVNEIADVVSQRVQISAKEIAEQVVNSIPRAEVDISEVVNQLRASMPESSGPALDIMEVKNALEESVWSRVEDEFKKLAGDLKERLETIRQESREGLDAAVEAKLMAAFNTYRNEINAIKDQGNGNGQNAAPGDKWGMAIQLVDRFLEKQNPIENIEQLASIYARLGNLFGGGGPDPTTLYRGNQQAFIEGIKIGARSKGGGQPFGSPFSSRARDVHSTIRPRPSSKIDKLIEDF